MKLPNFIQRFIDSYKASDKYLVRNYGPNRAERRAAEAEETKHNPKSPTDKHAATKARGLSKWGRLLDRAGVKTDL